MTSPEQDPNHPDHRGTGSGGAMDKLKSVWREATAPREDDPRGEGQGGHLGGPPGAAHPADARPEESARQASGMLPDGRGDGMQRGPVGDGHPDQGQGGVMPPGGQLPAGSSVAPQQAQTAPPAGQQMAPQGAPGQVPAPVDAGQGARGPVGAGQAAPGQAAPGQVPQGQVDQGQAQSAPVQTAPVGEPRTAPTAQPAAAPAGAAAQQQAAAAQPDGVGGRHELTDDRQSRSGAGAGTAAAAAGAAGGSAAVASGSRPAAAQPAAAEPAAAQPAAVSPQAGTGATDTRAEVESNRLLPADRAKAYGSRWDEVKGGFVDEPREAVRKADTLVGEILDDLEQLFRQQRSELEHGLDTDETSTEDLRQALHRYRSFFDRLLTL